MTNEEARGAADFTDRELMRKLKAPIEQPIELGDATTWSTLEQEITIKPLELRKAASKPTTKRAVRKDTIEGVALALYFRETRKARTCKTAADKAATSTQSMRKYAGNIEVEKLLKSFRDNPEKADHVTQKRVACKRKKSGQT